MKPALGLSINPSYYCNFRCEFCYLTPAQLGDKTRLPLTVLEARLAELAEDYSLTHVDLYGGETFLLPSEYLQELKALLHRYGITDINVNTNLSVNHPLIHDPDFYLSVSYDFSAREASDAVFNRMLSLQRPFSILMLCSPRLLTHSTSEIIQTLNLLSNLQSVEVKPYSPNQANDLPVTYREFEEFIKDLLQALVKPAFQLTNARLIEDALAHRRNAYSDDHVYITPRGRLAVLEFDDLDREYFLELPDVAAYRAWCQQERTRVQANRFCGSCRFQGRCLSEHLREVRSLEQSCNGFYHLLEWAEQHPLFSVTTETNHVLG